MTTNWKTSLGGILYTVGMMFQHNENAWVAWLAQGAVLIGPLLIGLAAKDAKPKISSQPQPDNASNKLPVDTKATVK